MHLTPSATVLAHLLLLPRAVPVSLARPAVLHQASLSPRARPHFFSKCMECMADMYTVALLIGPTAHIFTRVAERHLYPPPRAAASRHRVSIVSSSLDRSPTGHVQSSSLHRSATAIWLRPYHQLQLRLELFFAFSAVCPQRMADMSVAVLLTFWSKSIWRVSAAQTFGILLPSNQCHRHGPMSESSSLALGPPA